MNPHRIRETFRTVLAVTAFTAILAMSPVEISGQGKKPPSPPTTPGPQASKTKLEVRNSEQWGDALATTSLGAIAFRFSTSQPGARTAQWQVSDKPFSTDPKATAAQAPHVIASGNLGATPIPGTTKTVVINLAQLKFPPPFPKTPRGYWLFVVTKNAQNQTVGLSSAPVKIVYYLKLGLTAAGASRVKGTNLWKLTLGVNYIPDNAEVEIKRLRTDPFVNVWWAKDKWVNGADDRVLKPKISAGGIQVDLPADIGAGLFQARVRSRNPTQVTDWKQFTIHYPSINEGEVVLTYLGLKSLEETDEVGADEILVLFHGVHLSLTSGSVKQLAFHTDVDKGETHDANTIVDVAGGLRIRPLTFAVVEIDDGYVPKYTGGLGMIVNGGVIPKYKEIGKSLIGKSGKALLLPALQYYLKDQDKLVDNGDDLVTVFELPFGQSDVQQCMKTSAGVRKEVLIEGDGGRFKLLFHLLARPTK